MDIATLIHHVQEVEPHVRFLTLWKIRRAIRRLYGLLPSSARTAHEEVFAVSANALHYGGLAAELGLAEPLPETVILLPLPENGDDAEHWAVLYERKLFHAAIDRAIESRRANGQLSPEFISAWWYRQGGTLRHEIEAVLEGEHRLLIPGDSFELFREFVAFLLELHFFEPNLLGVYFPGLQQPTITIDDFKTMFDAESIRERNRLTSLVMHPPEAKAEADNKAIIPEFRAEVPVGYAGIDLAWQINDVRAIVDCQVKGQDFEMATHALRRLVERLRAPLRLDEAAATQWFVRLYPLLEPAAAGTWNSAKRLLYELQKACINVERKQFAVDLVETIITLGKQPLQRELTKPREIYILRRLRKAAQLADQIAVPVADRQALALQFKEAIDQAERRVRDSLRPDLEVVLDEVGLKARTQIERVARRDLIEELLDVACARGFLTISDVRDGIARNRLKLADLSGVYEWVAGDPLIRANRILAIRLDGVYHRGEIYMRMLQRLSSLAFGTAVGRFLTLCLILPFVGAFLLLEGSSHFVEAIESGVGLITGHNARLKAFGAVAGGSALTVAQDPDLGQSFLTSLPMVIATGVFIMAMIHAPPFRRRVAILARTVFHDLPMRGYRWVTAQGFFDNAGTRFVTGYLLVPLLVGTIAFLTVRLLRYDLESSGIIGGGLALLTGTLFRTSWGNGLEERFNGFLGRFWRIVSVNFVLGVFAMIFRIFNTIFEWLIRGIYAVDEWLRFRQGQSRFTFVFKVVFGLFWFFISYVIRFAWNLLVEPQINPIKHFPVVTVSHKLLLPLIPNLKETFHTSLGTMTTIVGAIPGIFGFLAWELKENWKLYRANQSPTLDPSVVGSHGEKLRGLLRPGFHSGVVPKTFAKLRKAESQGQHYRAAKFHHQLDHIAEAVHHFVDRGFVAMLMASQRWHKLPLRLQPIQLATNGLRMVLTIDGWDGSVVLRIEERNGWLIGSIEATAWLERLTAWQRSAFNDALAGLYKFSGVHLLRAEAAAFWKVEPIALDCLAAGPILAAANGDCRYFLYTDDRALLPVSAEGRALPDTETIPPGTVVFSDRPLTWQVWQQRWDDDRKGREPGGPLL